MSETIPDPFDEATLAKWLENKPRDFVTAFAVRASLFSLPGLGTLTPNPKTLFWAEELVLGTFRANVFAWAGAKYPTPEVTRACARAARSIRADRANAALQAESEDSGYDVIAALAARSASHAAQAGAGTADRSIPSGQAAAAAAQSIFRIAGQIGGIDSARQFLRMGLMDMRTQESASLSVAKYLGFPIWSDTPTRERFAELWDRLRKLLSQNDTNWRVWFDWAEAKFGGEGQYAYSAFPGRVDWPEAVYVALASWIDEWKRPPAEVNADIKRLLELHQSPTFNRALSQRFESRTTIVVHFDRIGSSSEASQSSSNATQNNKAAIAEANEIARGFEMTFSHDVGDGWYYRAQSAARAIQFAHAVVERSKAELRAAIHLGDAELIDERLEGQAVIEVSQFVKAGLPRRVIVSAAIRESLGPKSRNALQPHLTFKFKAQHEIQLYIAHLIKIDPKAQKLRFATLASPMTIFDNERLACVPNRVYDAVLYQERYTKARDAVLFLVGEIMASDAQPVVKIQRTLAKYANLIGDTAIMSIPLFTICARTWLDHLQSGYVTDSLKSPETGLCAGLVDSHRALIETVTKFSLWRTEAELWAVDDPRGALGALLPYFDDLIPLADRLHRTELAQESLIHGLTDLKGTMEVAHEDLRAAEANADDERAAEWAIINAVAVLRKMHDTISQSKSLVPGTDTDAMLTKLGEVDKVMLQFVRLRQLD